MKKNTIAFILYLILTNSVYAQSDKGVHFVQGLSWEQVREKAKTENKYIFMDCYASWCGPCKEMDKIVYPMEMVGDFINQHFISLKVQMDTSKQDDDQARIFYADAHFLMKEYKISEFPSLLFFSPDGKIVHKGVGFINEKGLISLAKDAMDSNKQFYTSIEKFKEGRLDTIHMKDLSRIASSLGDKELAGKIANTYIDHLDGNQLYKTENIWFMVEFTTSSKDRGFAVFKDHADRIHQVDREISEAAAKGFAENIIYKEEMKPYESSKNGKPDWTKMRINVKKYGTLGEKTFEDRKPDILFKAEIEPALKTDPDWNKVFALIKKQNAGKGEEYLVGCSIVFYLNNGLMAGTSRDCKNFVPAAIYYFKNYYSYLTADPLNTWAWTMFEQSSDKGVLATALIWSDSSLKKSSEPNAEYYDTYANLLHKLGRTREAIAWEEKAISLDPSNKVIHENFLKMKKGVPTWEND